MEDDKEFGLGEGLEPENTRSIDEEMTVDEGPVNKGYEDEVDINGAEEFENENVDEDQEFQDADAEYETEDETFIGYDEGIRNKDTLYSQDDPVKKPNGLVIGLVGLAIVLVAGIMAFNARYEIMARFLPQRYMFMAMTNTSKEIKAELDTISKNPIFLKSKEISKGSWEQKFEVNMDGVLVNYGNSQITVRNNKENKQFSIDFDTPFVIPISAYVFEDETLISLFGNNISFDAKEFGTKMKKWLTDNDLTADDLNNAVRADIGQYITDEELDISYSSLAKRIGDSAKSTQNPEYLAFQKSVAAAINTLMKKGDIQITASEVELGSAGVNGKMVLMQFNETSIKEFITELIEISKQSQFIKDSFATETNFEEFIKQSQELQGQYSGDVTLEMKTYKNKVIGFKFNNNNEPANNIEINVNGESNLLDQIIISITSVNGNFKMESKGNHIDGPVFTNVTSITAAGSLPITSKITWDTTKESNNFLLEIPMASFTAAGNISATDDRFSFELNKISTIFDLADTYIRYNVTPFDKNIELPSEKSKFFDMDTEQLNAFFIKIFNGIG